MLLALGMAFILGGIVAGTVYKRASEVLVTFCLLLCVLAA